MDLHDISTSDLIKELEARKEVTSKFAASGTMATLLLTTPGFPPWITYQEGPAMVLIIIDQEEK